MQRVSRLPYPPLEVAVDRAEVIKLLDRVAACEVPALTVGQNIGVETLKTIAARHFKSEWEHEQPFSKDPPSIVATIIRKAGLVNITGAKKDFHFDRWAGDRGHEHLRAHICDRPYLAIFATPKSEALPIMPGHMYAQQRMLWHGEVDTDMWQDVRLHRGQPFQPVIFRNLGVLPVAHHFLSTTFRTRNYANAGISPNKS